MNYIKLEKVLLRVQWQLEHRLQLEMLLQEAGLLCVPHGEWQEPPQLLVWALELLLEQRRLQHFMQGVFKEGLDSSQYQPVLRDNSLEYLNN